MTSGSLVLGVLNGMLIGLLAVGIVLVYKSNRFVNLAHAQLGALSAQLLGKVVIDWHWNWWLAFTVCVPAGIGVGLAVERLVIRPLREKSASAVTLLLATVGVTQILLALALVPALGPNARQLVFRGYPVAFHAEVHIGGVVLGGSDLMVLILLPAVVALLAALLRFSLLGKMIRATASNPDAARLAGVSAARMSVVTWALAGGLSAVVAILQSPSSGGGGAFDAASLGPQLLLLALGAAALGAFTSFSGALAGGLAIGIVQQATLAATANAGTAEVAVFGVIMAIVFIRGPAIGRAFRTAGSVVEDCPPLRIPEAVRDRFTVRYHRRLVSGGVLVAAILAPLVPVLRSDGERFKLALVLLYALVAVSLTVAIGWAGQISLGQFALVGVGAFVAAHLMPHGWSMPLLILVAGAAGAVFMVTVGLPALRVPGLTLAVTTLGLAVVAPDWLFRRGWFGASRSFGIDLNAPSLVAGLGHPGSQLVVYYTALVVLCGAAAALVALRRSQAGRIVIAVRDNEGRAATFGVTPATVKLAALAVSGFVAAAGGVLWADAWRTVVAGQFPAGPSLSVLAAAVIGGIGSVGGAIAGGVVLYSSSLFLSPHLGGLFGSLGRNEGFQLLVGGAGLVAVLRAQPQGLAGAARSWWQGRIDQMGAEAARQALVAAGADPLAVEEVAVAFGGIRALDRVSLQVRTGEIVGLIGPNGAGKTTLLDVVSGALTADGGRIVLAGIDVTGLAPEFRAAFGLARSFQQATLFPGLTVRETLQVALSTRHRTGLLSAAVAAPWVRAGEVRSHREADELLERFGLTAWADTLTADLSTGTRRICDLAAQVAAGPRILLLDEPTSGVAQREAESFGPLLRRIRAELDCSILLIEHDMPLLMGVCDRIYAMEAGVIIAEGTPAEIRADPRVVASYLGTDEAAIRRSGAASSRRNGRSAGQREVRTR